MTGESKGTPSPASSQVSNEENGYRFTKKDKGPFKAVVSLRKEYITPNTPPPKALVVSRDLTTKYNINFVSLERKGRYSWTVTFRDKVQANNALSNPLINSGECPFNISIPWHTVYRKLVMKGIPTDISEKEILEEMRGSNPQLQIEEIFRFKKRSVDNESSILSDTTTIKVTIRDSVVPSHVILWRTNIKVDIFIPNIRRCFKCGQLSHATKCCKNKSKCLRCGSDYDETHEICTRQAKNRMNRDGNHPSLDNNCP